MTLQQPRSRQEAKMLGLPDWQIDQMFPGGGLLDLPEAPPERIEAIGGLLGPEKPKGYFQGGDFRPRDGLSLLLASVADGMARNSGYEASTGESLFAGRSKALDEFKKKAEQERKVQELTARMRAAGLSDAQIDAELGGFKLPEPDEFDRNAQRAGIAPGSPEYVQAAKSRVLGDPVLAGVNLPSGAQFFGRLSELKGYTGGGATGGGTATEEEWLGAKPVGGGTGNGVRRFPVR